MQRFGLVLFLFAIMVLFGCGREHPIPRVEITTPISPQSGDMVIISYILYDLEGRPATIEVEYSVDGLSWKAATEGTGGDGKTSLVSAARGKAHSFVWNSVADLGYADYNTVYIRIRPTTKRTGNWARSGAFSVRNRKWNANVVVSANGYEPAVAVFKTMVDDKIYVVFSRDDSGDKNVYITLSTDGGNSFETPMKVPEATTGANQHRPDIAVTSDGKFYIVYQEDTSADSNVWCVSGTYDMIKGFMFLSPVQVDDDTTGAYRSERPKVVTAGTTVIVVWQNNNGGNFDVVMDVDSGSGFGTDTVVSDSTITQEAEPVVTLNAGATDLYIFWRHYNGTDFDIYCDHSTSADWRTFGIDIKVDSGTGNSQKASASAGASRFFALFEDDRNTATSGLDIILRYGDVGGFSEKTVSADTGDQTSPAITAYDDDNIFVFYIQNNGLFCKKGVYSASAWAFDSLERVDDDGSNAAKSSPDTALYGGVPLVVFVDNRSGTNAVYFAKRKP